MQKPFTLYKDVSILLTGIEVPPLPAEIEFEGQQLFVKDEFHITLLGVRFLAERIDPNNPDQVNNRLIQEFEQFVANTPLDQYKITGPLRFVDDGEEHRAIVVMASVPNLDTLFDGLERQFGELPRQQPHVTLYRFPKDFIGIPIPSAEELARISRPIELPKLTIGWRDII